MKSRLIFWLPNYPDVMYSFLLALVKNIDANVKIVCLRSLLKEREGLYGEDELSRHVQFIYYSEEENLDDFINAIISANKDAIYFFGGFLGKVGRALQLYHQSGGDKAVIITEKPSVRPAKHFNKIIMFLKRIKARRSYSKAYKATANSIKAVLVTGEKGVRQLKSFGIPEEKLYNFMYTHIEEEIQPKTQSKSTKVRFVYVGRFNYLNRGMDNLIYAFNKLEQENWTLDLVGGYGEDAEEIIAWAKNKDNVTYVGSWKSNQVINNLQNYDVCISPTRIDGWRIQVNQAIIAGIGTITTEEAISDELVKASGTGMVVDAFKKNELYKAVLSVIENPDIVNQWKENCTTYRDRISNEKIAKYVIEILEYVLSKDDKEKPRCPWL